MNLNKKTIEDVQVSGKKVLVPIEVKVTVDDFVKVTQPDTNM